MSVKSVEYVSKKSRALRFQAAIFFAVAIAAIGALMMAVTSSPSTKGASFLWLPAALQLIAGVWLGPLYGLLSAGLGAYAAGILSYGGWGLVDVIMNPVAGGLANGMLPALLFRWLKINPTLGAKATKADDVLKAAVRIGVLLMVVLLLAFAMKPLQIGLWGHVIPLILMLVAIPFVLRGLNLNGRDFILALVVVVLSCAASALIGAYGASVQGKPIQAALIEVGIGWFLGDTVSAVLGLSMLAAFTERARAAGIAD